MVKGVLYTSSIKSFLYQSIQKSPKNCHPLVINACLTHLGNYFDVAEFTRKHQIAVKSAFDRLKSDQNNDVNINLFFKSIL